MWTSGGWGKKGDSLISECDNSSLREVEEAIALNSIDDYQGIPHLLACVAIEVHIDLFDGMNIVQLMSEITCSGAYSIWSPTSQGEKITSTSEGHRRKNVLAKSSACSKLYSGSCVRYVGVAIVGVHYFGTGCQFLSFAIDYHTQYTT